MDLEKWNFREYRYRGALVVENKIVYFGSMDYYASFVLEEEKRMGGSK